MLVCHLIIKCVKMARKSFKDLSFKDNVAVIRFKNGYTARITKGGPATTVGSPYLFECIPINSIISDDAIGYCSEEDVTQLMHEVQGLAKIKN